MGKKGRCIKECDKDQIRVKATQRCVKKDGIRGNATCWSLNFLPGGRATLVIRNFFFLAMFNTALATLNTGYLKLEILHFLKFIVLVISYISSIFSHTLLEKVSLILKADSIHEIKGLLCVWVEG